MPQSTASDPNLRPVDSISNGTTPHSIERATACSLPTSPLEPDSESLSDYDLDYAVEIDSDSNYDDDPLDVSNSYSSEANNSNSFSDSEDEDKEMELEDHMIRPIYENANITLCGAYCAIMEFKRACRLPFTAIAMLLQLLQLLCPKDNTLPKSVYVFKKFFQRFSFHFNDVYFVQFVMQNSEMIRKGVIILHADVQNLIH